MTLLTSGFCCSSGKDMNSSIESEPEPSRSNFLNRFPSLLISSESKAAVFIGREASLPMLADTQFIYTGGICNIGGNIILIKHSTAIFTQDS